MRIQPLGLFVAFLLSPLLLLMSPAPAQGHNQGILNFQVDGSAQVGFGPYFNHIAAWHDTGMQVLPGHVISLTAEGGILRSWPSQHVPADTITSGPDGEDVLCSFANGQTHCILEHPAYSLVGKIGMDGTPFFVGSSFEGIAEAAGALFLAFNDSYYFDNSGHFMVSGSIVIEDTCEEPEALAEAMMGDVRSVRVNAPGMRTVRECMRRDRNGDSDSDSDSHKRCHRVRRFDSGGYHYSFSVDGHGMTEIMAGSLVITARDLDLIPEFHSRRHGRRWSRMSETMRISTGGYELAFLDEAFAVDHGITETNDVSVTYTVELDADAMEALAASGYEIAVDLESAYENHRGSRFHRNDRDEVSVLVLLKDH